MNVKALLQLFPAMAAFLPLSCASMGCASPEKTLSSHVEAVTPVVFELLQKAGDENTARSYQMQATGNMNDPGYEVDFEGIVGTAVKGKASIRLKGVAVQGSVATQGDAGQPATVEPPVNRGGE